MGTSGEPKGLINGGATACLRTAEEAEKEFPEVTVNLACGACALLVNAEGTLLSRSYMSARVRSGCLRNKLALLTVEQREVLLSDSAFRYLVQQDVRGRIKGLFASPPYRTLAWSRYSKSEESQRPRPVRLRGESIGDFS